MSQQKCCLSPMRSECLTLPGKRNSCSDTGISFAAVERTRPEKGLHRCVYVFNTGRAKIEAKSDLWKTLAHLRDKTVPSSEKHEGLSHGSWMRSLYWRAAHATSPIVEKYEFPSALKYLYSG